MNNIKLLKDETTYIDLKSEISKLLSKQQEIAKNNEKIENEHKNRLTSLIEESELKINNLKSTITNLENQIRQKKEDIIILDDEALFQSFGFYEPKYNLLDSESYKNRLDGIREKQKDMVKSKSCVFFPTNFTLDGSIAKGKKMVDDNIKLIIRSFNNECDSSILKVKFNNVESIKQKIQKAFDTLNNLSKKMMISLTYQYLDLKIEELYLSYEYEKKKQEEKEEQQRIREQIREEQKVLKEIQAQKEKIEKEEKHFSQEIENLQSKLDNSSEIDKQKYLDKIKELEAKLQLLSKDKEDVYNREQNTRAGYVYIISNIGSFGENIYKIGMTRRLEPMDRVKELGDASVPFSFDVHAMIFSEDAPSLENELHKHFDKNRLNKVNLKKEFFNVSLAEIEKVVKDHHNKTVEFTKLAQANEYRESLVLDKKINKQLA